MIKHFLPASGEEFKRLDWAQADIILVTGDAYVDHPSYGAAVIGRVLEREGFRVGIIAQPDWKDLDDFRKLGRPKLFFGVTAGNIDSMVANYTANKRPRKNDEYSPGQKAHLRPDRAVIAYANRIREAFGDIPIILGGLEASMRRLAYYDYWNDRVRRSILVDSRADMLIYGMGEKQILETAKRLRAGKKIGEISDVAGTVIVRSDTIGIENYVMTPSFEEMAGNKDKFNLSFRVICSEADHKRGRPVIQPHANRFVIQQPPAVPLTTKEMDALFDLPYMRSWHPSYDKDGGVPGFETVRFSVISHRGCCGGCSFCSLFLHQGRVIQSRSEDSILREIKKIAADRNFRGTITDIGGPTANLYGAECDAWNSSGACRDKSCLMPKKCAGLKLGYDKTIKLWKKALAIARVKHVFVGSGVRYDLLTDQYSDRYLHELCASHISGRLKVAPEHIDPFVLELMNKPYFDIYEKFVRRYHAINNRLKKKQYLVNYFISAHPGSGLKEAERLSQYLEAKHMQPEQIQDFIPLPMTMSGCMYYTEKDPFTGKKIYVAKTLKERLMQRALIQNKQPKNRRLVSEAIGRLKKEKG